MATQATPTPSASPLHGPLVVAYPHLLTPRTTTFDGKTKTRFEATILVPKDKPDQVEKLKAAIRSAFVSKFGSEAKLAKDKQPMKDGDAPTTEDGDDKGKYPGFFYANVNAFEDNPPVLKHSDGSLITDPAGFKSGDWAYVALKARAYTYENTKGVALDILGLRKYKNGEPIGGNGAAEKAAAADALDALVIEAAAGDDEF